MMLPDSATIYGRLFLGAWDAGLDNVADDTVNLMLHATEVTQCYQLHDMLSNACNQERVQEQSFGYDFAFGCKKRQLLICVPLPLPFDSDNILMRSVLIG